MKPHFQASFDLYRRVIHQAESSFAPPHEYMNFDHPLTPLKHEFVPGEPVPRIAALRHALYLLENVEGSLIGIDKMVPAHQEKVYTTAFSTFNCVAGILWAHGIGSDDSAQQLAA